MGDEMSNPRDWDLEYDGAAPPLPEEIKRNYKTPLEKEWVDRVQKLLPTGAYLLWFEPKIALENARVELPKVLAGPLRIHHELIKGKTPRIARGFTSDRLISTGSADLYSWSSKSLTEIIGGLGSQSESERLKALQFPPESYRYYLRLTSLWITGRRNYRLLLDFDSYRYDPSERVWQKRQSIKTELKSNNGSPSISHPAKRTRDLVKRLESLSYDVTNSQGTSIGTARFVRLTKGLLRSATVRIHAVEGVKTPDNQKTWREALEPCNWSIGTSRGKRLEFDEEGPTRTAAELAQFHRETFEGSTPGGQETALETKSKANPPRPWVYDLLVVDQISATSLSEDGPLGLMFDTGLTDRTDLPRMAAAIAARALIKNGKMMLEENSRFFHWTAIHELGHMQGLYHSPEAQGLMSPWGHSGEIDSGFQFQHLPIDRLRLRHLPDLWVRPGGLPFGHRYRASAVDLRDLLEPSEGLKLEVRPPIIPLGKPVGGFTLELRNDSSEPVLRPFHAEAQPFQGCLGAYLLTPSDRWLEISPVSYPRTLRNSELKPLQSQGSALYEVTWPAGLTLRQPGLYKLQIFLAWIAEHTSKNEEVKSTLYYAATEAQLHVVEGGGSPS
jgi:hypothetical protein